MTPPNLAALTASLERSLQSCSLNPTESRGGVEDGAAGDSPEQVSPSHATLDLHSDVSLPYHWEQCLDLKTGKIYYFNWRTGMRVNEDPRTSAAAAEYGGSGGDVDDDEGEVNDDGEGYGSEEEDGNLYGSEESSSESPPAAAPGEPSVLVVAGCTKCLTYYMVPKLAQECPKCSAHLLHFDRSDHGSP